MKIVKSLDEQIQEYKQQFEFYAKLKQWIVDNPEPEHGRLETDKSDMDVVLRFPIYQKLHSEWRKGYYNKLGELTSQGYGGYQWNWGDDWDGQLIKDLKALESVGFTIISFSRKRKITLDYVSTLLDIKKYTGASRVHIMKCIEHAELIGMDSNWYSISFKPTLSIYWQGRSTQWR